jgi:hypothetical protein
MGRSVDSALARPGERSAGSRGRAHGQASGAQGARSAGRSTIAASSAGVAGRMDSHGRPHHHLRGHALGHCRGGGPRAVSRRHGQRLVRRRDRAHGPRLRTTARCRRPTSPWHRAPRFTAPVARRARHARAPWRAVRRPCSTSTRRRRRPPPTA